MVYSKGTNFVYSGGTSSAYVLRTLLILVLLVALAGGVYLFFNLPFFLSFELSCKTQYGLCTSEDIKAIEKFKQTSFIKMSLKDVEAEVLKDPKNKKAWLGREFPRKLNVFIEKRKPRAAVDTGKNVFVVSQDGVVISTVSQTSLPLLIYNKENLDLGQTLEEFEKKALEELYQTTKIVGVLQASLFNKTLEMNLEQGSKVYLPLEGNSQVLVGSLQLILSQARMEQKFPKEIDLRFKSAVLRY